MKIGNKLKKARERCGMSQSEVAETLHLARQTVSKWETDRSSPDLANLAALSQLYQVSLDELLGSENGEVAAEYMEKESEAEEKSEEKAEPEEKSEEKEVVEEQKTAEKAEVDWREQGLALAVALVSGLFPILGIIVPIVILWKYRKAKNALWLKILLVICIFVGVYNCWVLIQAMFFDYYHTNIELVK